MLSRKYMEPGQCYKNSLRWQQENPEWTLVHGIVWNPKLEVKMGHAWCEKGDFVYDPTHDVQMRKAAYYALGKVGYTHRYNQKSSLDLVVKFETYGPWDWKIDKAAHKKKMS